MGKGINIPIRRKTSDRKNNPKCRNKGFWLEFGIMYSSMWGALVLEKTWRAICSQQLFDTGDKVILAVSGGADSMAMLHIIFALRERLGLSLHVAHLNHMMRGEAAFEDALFVRDISEELGIPCSLGTADVPAMIADQKLSPEDAARKARYEFLFRTAETLKADKIAVAHHGDDQAETLLMHLLKGTGPEGLGGMLPKTGCIVRPLLSFRRWEIEQYCLKNGIRFRNDITNEDLAYTRNRIRHHLLPVLTEYNPGIVEALMKTAEIIQAENDYFKNETSEAFKKIVRIAENNLGIDSSQFGELDKALQRRLVRSLFRKLCCEDIGLEFSHVERLREFILTGQTGKSIQLPQGVVAEKNYREVSLMAGSFSSEETEGWEQRLLALPGITCLPELDMEIIAEILPAEAVGDRVFTAEQWEAYMDWQKLQAPLVAAPRKPGCMFHPLGSPGRKSLKEFFIDAKVPGKERGQTPVISDSQGIVWVAGHRIDERVKVTKGTRQILRLQIRRAGNTPCKASD